MNINELTDLSKKLYSSGINCYDDIEYQLEKENINLNPLDKMVLLLIMDYRDQAAFIRQELCREDNYINNLNLYLKELTITHEYFDFLLEPFNDEQRYESMRFHSEDTYRNYAENILAPKLKDNIYDTKKVYFIKKLSEQESITGVFTDKLNFSYDNIYAKTIAEELDFKIKDKSPRLETALNNAKGSVRFEVVLDEKLFHWDLK